MPSPEAIRTLRESLSDHYRIERELGLGKPLRS
jgi:hypothetical protein